MGSRPVREGYLLSEIKQSPTPLLWRSFSDDSSYLGTDAQTSSLGPRCGREEELHKERLHEARKQIVFYQSLALRSGGPVFSGCWDSCPQNRYLKIAGSHFLVE